ncbi:MAG: aspartate aminotransferase family protein [Proteobacteria bacterium]|nr:aspartate aminotransferase family protein [Pseudomonadota bacterium]
MTLSKALSNSRIVAAYREKTPTSEKRHQKALGIFPGAVTHDSRYILPHNIYCDRAAGSRKWDLDGNEYVDYHGGHGALILGHCHPEVMAAVHAQLDKGTHLGASTELEMRWGELVQELIPSAERVRFTASGTEATLMALRLARAFTGKSRLLRFRGHFHGWHDHMAFGVTNHFDGTPTPGVLDEIARNVVLVDPNDREGLRRALAEHDDIAAAILEPTGSTYGQVPIAPAFLKELRAETKKHGVVLIFDEVVTGFRCSPGGAQAALGVIPDMSTLAKVLSGGLPGGAVVGRKDIMDALDPAWAQATGREKVPHQGTYNANPVSAAAGVKTLEILKSTDANKRACAYAERLRKAINQAIEAEGLPWAAYGTFTGTHIFTNANNLPGVSPKSFDPLKFDYTQLKAKRGSDTLTKLRLAMRVNGVDLSGWPGGPASAVHTDNDLERTVGAFRKSVRMLRDEGEIA